MPVTRSDVVDAYRVILGREPEGDEVVELQASAADDRTSLVRNVVRSREAQSRLGLVDANHVHHVYRGYVDADLPVIYGFQRTEAPGTPGFVTNFLGGLIRVGFAGALAPHDGDVEGYPLPAGGYQGETAEYVGALRSVLDVRDGRYRMLECGAGYGTWMVLTTLAARRLRIGDVHAYGVEGDLGHCEFLRQHMADNSVGEGDYTLLEGAVGTKSGRAEWPVADDPAQVYGGRPLASGGVDYHGGKPGRTVKVEVFALPEILSREPVWDLVHVDIQGGEGALCRECVGALTERVRRVVVGTHSRALDGEVMSTFHRAGWSLENEKPTIYHWRDGSPTLETLASVDGVQAWRNPRLAG